MTGEPPDPGRMTILLRAAHDGDREAMADLRRRAGTKLVAHGPKLSLADMAIAPFVRQFANVDRAWFDGQPWPHLTGWLERFGSVSTRSRR